MNNGVKTVLFIAVLPSPVANCRLPVAMPYLDF